MFKQALLKALNIGANPDWLQQKSLNLLQKFGNLSYEQSLALQIIDRPHYGYCVYHSAALAKKLGYSRISVVEFGVAGGNGLINLEYHAEQVSKIFGIDIDIYGFDTGEGLPKPIDYRDLPYHWQESFFKMNIPELKNRLTKAQLVLGDIRETVTNFFQEYQPAPIAAMFHDFDYYSSTIAAFKMFDEDEKYLLPRIYCYLDDVIGSEIELYNDYTGIRLAVNEFNENHSLKKLSPAYHLLTRQHLKTWYHQIYIYHDFSHSKYNQFISSDAQQLPLQ
ncbi:hypothetical protein C7H19_06615 [Aphanothece hegewaldii CCALA 016]|uniref:Uncharacterized protein n=1 Tax=Aphanothece hegewaldii CCALA 016 TaxID=2107694 RepID=A0A2T1M0E9_9CHRO|nr:hypothetical protein [Aphanothece hegewaldii]PSF38138.1 hypothetical protein C7H19_06615 [Aphanothece hegewaldii CCALA 016]